MGVPRARGLRGLPRVVWLLGFASLFNDVSSEAIFPLLPVYLAGLGGGMRFLGLVEGSADALASAVKVVAGRLSDRGPRRLLVVGGYSLPAVARAGIAAALRPWHVLGSRLLDRLGKGIRSGPRDALLADAAAEGDRGRAFGLQRSMDHLGAALGPLLASAMLACGASLGTTFAVAAGLGMAAPLVLLWRLEDPSPSGRGHSDSTETARGEGAHPSATPGDASRGEGARPSAALGGPFRRYLVLSVLFALGNSTDAFLLARAGEVGFSPAAVPLLWFGHHLVKTLTGAPGGALSDRLPRGLVVAAGWGAYALAYLGFALAATRLQVALLFGGYALYHGLCEAAERALVSDLVGPGLRGRAYGWYHGAIGLGALPAGLLTGWLWESFGSRTALLACAVFASAAALGLAASPSLRRPSR
ncbi:MAG TPA: MFS transporter [Anaeromyxobacteraceae bacterium]|nr:MFS transporter [Anaeromyxobacteraceae bacterium]